jgi:hypothetical protein
MMTIGGINILDQLGTLVGTLAIPLGARVQTSSEVRAESTDSRRNSTNKGGGLRNRWT